MAAYLFSRLERFREESLVMVAHRSIAQIDNHESLTHPVTQSVAHVGIQLLEQLKTDDIQ